MIFNHVGKFFVPIDARRRVAPVGYLRYHILQSLIIHVNRIGVYSYDKESGEYFFYDTEKLPAVYHGTGDIFASSTVGAMMCGMSVNDALALAVDYTKECIALTLADENRRFYGVNFEEALPMYISRIPKAL